MTESEIQKHVFAEIAMRKFPGVVAWHCPNGPEARRKSGYLAGVSDVNAVHRGKFYALELKTEEGEASDDQERYLAHVRCAGGHGYVSHGLDDAIEWLVAQGLLRRAA